MTAILAKLNFVIFILTSDEPLICDEIPCKLSLYWVGCLPPIEDHVACACYADVQEACTNCLEKGMIQGNNQVQMEKFEEASSP